LEIIDGLLDLEIGVIKLALNIMENTFIKDHLKSNHNGFVRKLNVVG